MNIDTLATPVASTSDAEIHAARFTIGDITVVRLVPTKLLQAMETFLETVGLTLAATRQVGRTAATQPMGFIDWVAIHRPDDLPIILPLPARTRPSTRRRHQQTSQGEKPDEAGDRQTGGGGTTLRASVHYRTGPPFRDGWPNRVFNPLPDTNR